MIVPSQWALKTHTNFGCAASLATLDKLVDRHRQHSKPIERKLLCILSVFLETHPPQAVRGRCRFIKIKIAETYAKIKKIYIF
jgi:hypothetical protein